MKRLLFILLTLLSTKVQAYEREVRAYVLADGDAVEAQCDQGDKMLKGDCLAEERMASEPHLAVHLVSEESAAKGWSCRIEPQDVRQVIKVTARAFCLKN